MFDKIFKILALLILGFIAYTFYLYTLNTRYYSVSNRIVLDRKTGSLHAPELIRAKIDKTSLQQKPEPIFKSREEALEFLKENTDIGQQK